MTPPKTRITGLAGLYKGRSSEFDYPLLTIGRARSNGLSFPLDLTLSREHAQIVFRNGDWVAQDLGSSNGTFVNGHRLPPQGTVTLRPGDVVKCGFQSFRLEWTPVAPSRPAPPVQVAPVSRTPAQEPVALRPSSVAQTPLAPTHRIPPPPAHAAPTPKKAPPHRWVAPNERIEIHGRRIDAGLFFYGTGKRNGMNYGAEPSLIDPTRPVDTGGEEGGEGVPTYRPGYAELAPRERARFLDWMAAGRPPEAMHDTDGLLFLAGIERRFLSEKGGRTDGIDEAHRELRRIAGGAQPGSRAAAKMREFLLLADPGRPSDAELLETAILDSDGRGGFASRLLLARRAMRSGTLAAEEALLAVLADEEMYPRTPFYRCRVEAESLFRARVERRYPQGVAIRTLKGPLEFGYSPANPGLYGARAPVGDLRDYQIAPATKAKLREFLTEATDALDAYSRRLANREHEAGRLPAVGLLPEELAKDHPGIRRLAEVVGEGGRFDLERLWEGWPTDRALNKAEREMLARALWHAGYVAEPGSSVSTDVLFVAPRVAESRFDPSAGFAAALPLVSVAALVVLADGRIEVEERERARARLSSLASVDAGDALRLGLYLDWLLETGVPKLGKKTFDAVDPSLRRPLLRLLAEVASADGHVAPAEAKEIVRIAKGLGVPEEEVYPMLHQIHDRPVASKPSSSPSGLDMDLIAQKLVASRAASEILGAVFVEDEEEVAPKSVPVFSAPSEDTDDPSLALLRELTTQNEWTARDFAALAAKYGKLPAATYDELNEAALDAVGDPLLDGDDPISVDASVAEEMLR